MAREQRSKITLTNIGTAARVKTENLPQLFMGRIAGKIERTVERKSPDGSQTFDGFGGEFVMLPSDTANFPELESGILFLPDAFHNLLAASFEEGKKKDENAKLTFAFDVYSVAAKNPQGYSWGLQPVIERTENEMDKFLATLPAPGTTRGLPGRKTLEVTDQSVKDAAKAKK